MRIYINSHEALLRPGTEIEYTESSAVFSDSDGFTLEMSLPVCRQNRVAFGLIDRADVAKDNARYPCRIVDIHFHKSGTFVVTEVTDTEVKGQFLAGVKPGDKDELPPEDRLLMNEIDLGSYPYTSPSQITPRLAAAGTDNEVCYRWGTYEYDVVNNRPADGSTTEWHEETTRLTWQPRLVPLMHRAAAAAGYTLKLGLVNFVGKSLVVCNTLPPSWYMTEYCEAMPPWTIREFFDKLGRTLKCVFEWDTELKTLTATRISDIHRKPGTVALRQVVDSYTSEVSDSDSDRSDYEPLRKYRYKHTESKLWNVHDAPWFPGSRLKRRTHSGTWDTLGAVPRLYQPLGGHRNPDEVVYLEDIDTYMVMRSVMTRCYATFHYDGSAMPDKDAVAKYYVWEPLNNFGPRDWTSDTDGDYEELDVVPVDVDWLPEGRSFIIPCGELDGKDTEAPTGPGQERTTYDGCLITKSTDLALNPATVQNIAQEYDPKKKEAYFDTLYIGHKNPSHDHPWPVVDVEPGRKGIEFVWRGLRLCGSDGKAETEYPIDEKVKYTFTFLSDRIPDVNAVFEIHGQRFLCRCIRATLSPSGLARKMQGDFYRLVN